MLTNYSFVNWEIIQVYSKRNFSLITIQIIKAAEYSQS